MRLGVLTLVHRVHVVWVLLKTMCAIRNSYHNRDTNVAVSIYLQLCY